MGRTKNLPRYGHGPLRGESGCGDAAAKVHLHHEAWRSRKDHVFKHSNNGDMQLPVPGQSRAPRHPACSTILSKVGEARRMVRSTHSTGAYIYALCGTLPTVAAFGCRLSPWSTRTSTEKIQATARLLPLCC